MNLKGAQIFRPLYLPHGLLSTDLRRLSQLRSVPAVQAMRLNPEAAGVCAEKPEWINRIWSLIIFDKITGNNFYLLFWACMDLGSEACVANALPLAAQLLGCFVLQLRLTVWQWSEWRAHAERCPPPIWTRRALEWCISGLTLKQRQREEGEVLLSHGREDQGPNPQKKEGIRGKRWLAFPFGSSAGDWTGVVSKSSITETSSSPAF